MFGKMKNIIIPLFLFLSVFTFYCGRKPASHSFPLFEGPYLGQQTPGNEPKIFAPIINCHHKQYAHPYSGKDEVQGQVDPNVRINITEDWILV